MGIELSVSFLGFLVLDNLVFSSILDEEDVNQLGQSDLLNKTDTDKKD